MPFELLPLPYEKTALEPHISSETLEFHHGKHHAAYVKKVNDLIEGDAALTGASLVDVVKAARKSDNKPLFNSAAQIWNHNFYWLSLSPDAQEPSEALAKLIADAFGSTPTMLEHLTKASIDHFSNGWAWLVLEGGELAIKTYHDAETPILTDDVKPLFTLDVWEHAYYIDYRNARPDYAGAALQNLINWQFVSSNLDGAGAQRADQNSG